MPSGGIAAACRELLPRACTLARRRFVFLWHLLSAGRLPSCRLPVRKYGGSCCPDFPPAAPSRLLPAIETVAVSFVKVLSCFQFAKVPLFFDIRKKNSLLPLQCGFYESLVTILSHLQLPLSSTFSTVAFLSFRILLPFFCRFQLQKRKIGKVLYGKIVGGSVFFDIKKGRKVVFFRLFRNFYTL